MRHGTGQGQARGLLPLAVTAVLANAFVVLTAWITGAAYCPGGTSQPPVDSTSFALNFAVIGLVAGAVCVAARRSRLSWSGAIGMGAVELCLAVALAYATFNGEAFSCWSLKA